MGNGAINYDHGEAFGREDHQHHQQNSSLPGRGKTKKNSVTGKNYDYKGF
jgi:hypothetical protein